MKKPHVTLITAAAFVFAACDGEKVQDAKKESAEAAKSIGEAAKEMTGKAMEKGNELSKAAGDKLKSATEAAKELVKEKGGPAMDSFKAKMGGLSEWFKQAKGQAGEDPAKAHELMGEMMTKVNSISAEGLPDDLKSAFEGYQATMLKVQEISKSLPKDAAGAEAWYRDNADRLRALENDTIVALKRFKEAAAKHGLTGLDLGSE
jgi:hypothetical protein